MTEKTRLLVASDIHGLLRGKRIPADSVPKIAAGEVKMPFSILFPDVWGSDLAQSDHLLDSGDLDGVLMPTNREPFHLHPWQPDTELQLGWMFHESGAPYLIDPRQALAQVVKRYEERGLTPVCAVELEFYLFDPAQQPLSPPRRPGFNKSMIENDVYALDDLEAFAPLLDALYLACARADVPVDVAIAEYGCGQFEINLKHRADALQAADDAQLLKYLVKRCAEQHGFGATFMAKPYGDDLGNGMHVHWSLLDRERRNVFAGVDESRGSAVLESAIAGVLNGLPESMLLLAPHYNSYRRFSSDSLAPTRISWGYDNRTAAVRIPAGEPAAQRIEQRVAGADANPYLVLTALLGSGLRGIDAEAVPPNAATGNQYQGTAPELPGTWASAIEAFRSGSVIAELFDPLFVHLFVTAKEQELERFNAEISAFEYETYLHRF